MLRLRQYWGWDSVEAETVLRLRLCVIRVWGPRWPTVTRCDPGPSLLFLMRPSWHSTLASNHSWPSIGYNIPKRLEAEFSNQYQYLCCSMPPFQWSLVMTMTHTKDTDHYKHWTTMLSLWGCSNAGTDCRNASVATVTNHGHYVPCLFLRTGMYEVGPPMSTSSPGPAPGHHIPTQSLHQPRCPLILISDKWVRPGINSCPDPGRLLHQ